jgi:hypothetical protein
MLSFLFSFVVPKGERSRIRVHNSVNPFRGTPPFTRTKWEFGSFTPKRVPAYRPSTLKFAAEWKTPFFIRIGDDDPLLGDPDPGRTRCVKIPPKSPGIFTVSLSFDGIQWKELGQLTVDAPWPGIPWDLLCGIVIGLSIVAAVCGIGLYAWRMHVRRQRRKRQRRSDEGGERPSLH